MKQKKSGSARRIVCLVLAAVMLLGLVSSALIIMVNAASSSEIKKELTGLRSQQAELKKEREALQAKIKENQSKTQTLVDKKSDIDQQISMTQASISNLNEQVQQYSLLIANKQAELEASQAEEKRLNEQYKTRIRSMEETGSISYWAILFGANSFSDLLDKIDVIQEIAKADQLMMDKMKAVSEKITSERTELEQQMAELDVTREELDQQEQELEENVLALLQEYDMVDECIIGSMNRGILQRVKELEPDISTVYIAHDLGEDDYDLDYADSYSIEGKNLTADMVEAIHYEGKSVYGWTANTSGAMRQIVNSGADGIVTDDVRLLQAFLRENACRKAFESVY